jgi:uncharacterized protein YkwD
MKKILFILFVLISTIGYSQTKLDSLLLNKINNYRNDNGLQSLIWNNSLYKVADNQSEYMFLTNQLTHDQEYYSDSSVLKDFEPQPNFSERFIRYIDNENIRYVGENLVIHKVESDIETINLDSIVNELLITWKNSPPHNKLLLNPLMCEAALSNKFRKNVMEIDPLYLDLYFFNKLYVSFETYSDPINE